jgi:hypothetical protein
MGSEKLVTSKEAGNEMLNDLLLSLLDCFKRVSLLDHLQNTSIWIVATIVKGVFCKWSFFRHINGTFGT